MNTKNKRAKSFIKELTGHITFGEVLLSFRLVENLTQVEMAKKLEISRQDLCNIEKGRKQVSIERAAKFAKKLGRSPKVFAKYVIQDQLLKSGVKVIVELKDAA
jgi:DNA-binding XRE family transcriptional regulator